MKQLILLSALMFIFLNESLAQEVIEPSSSYQQVLHAVFQSAGVTSEEVEVIVFTYNYLDAVWHVEITPKSKACIDCYPAFYIEQSKGLKVTKIPHG